MNYFFTNMSLYLILSIVSYVIISPCVVKTNFKTFIFSDPDHIEVMQFKKGGDLCFSF
jgi:hypothetical protein